MIAALLLALCPQQITEVQGLRDPAPAANDPIPRWENAYGELAGSSFSGYVRPTNMPRLLWEKQAFIDHLTRLHGKGGLPFNPRGKWYSGATTWGVGQQGWTSHRPMIYQVHRVYHYRGAAFGMPWGSIAWYLPEFRPGTSFGTPRPTGTATNFQFWDVALDFKIQFLWWKWMKATGTWHPWCIGAWSGRCGPPPPVVKRRNVRPLIEGRAAW